MVMVKKSYFVCVIFLALCAVTLGAPRNAHQDLTTNDPNMLDIPPSVSLKKASKALHLLNKQVNECLKGRRVVNEFETTTTSDTIGKYAFEGENEEFSDTRFSDVLRDLEDLELHVQDAIANFTANRRFGYSALLRPMVTNIRELRTNLTLLRNRMIGIVALNSVASQVTSLQSEIGDAISSVPANQPSGQPSGYLNTSPEEADELKELQESLGWVTE